MESAFKSLAGDGDLFSNLYKGGERCELALEEVGNRGNPGAAKFVDRFNDELNGVCGNPKCGPLEG